MTDYEWTSRQNLQLNRLIRYAYLKVHTTPEEIDYEVKRKLYRPLMRQLLTGQRITAHHNLLITGPTRVGKTHLICALATAACRQGFRVRYYLVPRLMQDIMIALVRSLSLSSDK